MRKLKSLLPVLIFAVAFSLTLPVFAEETTTSASTAIPADVDKLLTDDSGDVSAEAVEDATVSDAELGIAPVTSVSAIGNWLNSAKQKISLTFTFDKLKNAKKHLQYGNEKMARARIMLEKAANREEYDKALEQIEKADAYLDKTKEFIDELRNRTNDERAKELTKLEDNYTNQLILQERILQKLETVTPEQAFEKIKAARERRLEHLKNVFEKIDNNNQEKIAARLERVFGEQQGSELKPLTDLEFIEQLKEKYPDKQKEIFDRIMNLRHKELAENMKEMPAGERVEKLKDYLNFNEALDPEKKAKLLSDRRELLEKISNSPALTLPLKSAVGQAKNFLEKNQAVAEEIKEKTDVLKEKAEKGDEKAKEVLQKIEEKTTLIKQARDERIQKILPAFDENKWDAKNKKPILTDDSADQKINVEIKDSVPSIKITPVGDNGGIIIKPAIKATVKGAADSDD